MLLSRLSITGVGTYTDFYPSPMVRPGEYEATDYEAADYQVDDYTEMSALAVNTDTKLLSPLVFDQALPDDFDGTPGVQRLTADLSNLPPTKMLPPRQLLGVTATGELWDVEQGSLIETQTGVITEVDCGPDRLSLTIEQDAAAPLQTLIPQRLVRDIFPSADFSNLSTNGDPCVILPWGTMYKVPLALCQRPYLEAQFQMQADANGYLYVDMIDIPDYVVQSGDRLQYDIHDPFGGAQIALDVGASDGTALRDTGAVDQNGISSHPATNLDAVAFHRWYRREILLTPLVGKTLVSYVIGCEADTTRGCIAYLANARIVDSTGALRLSILNEQASGLFVITAQHPLTNAVGLAQHDWYDYGPIRTPASGALTIHAVYRGSAVIPPSEYTLVEPLPGLTTIRFTSVQRDTTGELAAISATFSSTEFARNPARVKQFLLSDSTDGVGLAVDPVSFADAALILTDARIQVEGGLSVQRPALDVMRDLTFYGEQLGMNAAGQYTDQADSAGLHPLNPLHLGDGDGQWENARLAPASFRLLDQLKSLTVKALLVQDFGGSETYAISAFRSQAVAGSTVTHEEPYLSPYAVDRETYYRFTRNAQASLYRAGVTATSLELLPVRVNDLVILHCPVDPDLDGRTMLVTGRQASAERIAFTLRGHDAALYAYLTQPIQLTGVPPLIDYRFTIPGTPANFIVWVQAPTVTSDGSVKNYLTVQADAPGANVTELRFRAIIVGSVLFTEVPVAVSLGQTAVRATFALEPGLTYHFECYAYNNMNAAGYRYSVPAQILNYTTDGDMTAPAAGAAVVLTQAGAKAVQIEAVFTPPADWGTTLLYRNTVNNTASAVLIDSGKKKVFHDQTIVYNVTYFYWFKVGDNTFVATGSGANLSDFSPSAGHSILIQRLVTDDYGDDSISTQKYKTLSVTSAIIDDLAVTNAKINDLAVTSAKIDDLAVSNAKISDVSADKILTGALRINEVGNGASVLHVDAPAAIRMETDPSTPAKIIFQEAATGNEQARITGKGGSLAISPTTDASGIVLEIGEAGLRWSTVNIQSAGRISLKSGGTNSVFIDGRLGSSAVESSVPPGATPNRRIPVYNSVGSIVMYVWGSI